jgi:O-acetyl-ADP-ribose deacetylase (regulator of RNase III)
VPVILTKGDLLNTEGLHAFAHTCDQSGAMASGISLAFRKRWPKMAEAFAERAAQKPIQMGETLVWSDGVDTVFSLVVQSAPDNGGKNAALDRAVQQMIEAAVAAGIDQIAVSRLGAGPAKLDWTRVKRVLVERAEGAPVTLHAFEQFVRKTDASPLIQASRASPRSRGSPGSACSASGCCDGRSTRGWPPNRAGA